MADLRQSGKIRAIGLSNVTVDDIRRAHACLLYTSDAADE